MGEHHYNRAAQAKARGDQPVTGLDLGEGVALIGTQIMPVTDDEGNLVILLCAIGGHTSPIVGGFAPRPVVIAELAKVPLAAVRRALKGRAAAVETPPVPAGVEPPAAAPAEEPEPSKLLLFGGER